MRKGRDFTHQTRATHTSRWISRLKESIRYLKKNDREEGPYGLGFVVGAIFYIFDRKYDPFLASIINNAGDSRDFKLMLRELVPKNGLHMGIVKKRLERTNKRAQGANTQTLNNNPDRQAYIILKQKLPDFIRQL